jgi:hypothetical protein
MINENDASVKIGGSVNKSEVEGGKIDAAIGTKETKNNASLYIEKDVTDDSKIKGGTIKVSEPIDIAQLIAELKAEFKPFLEKLAESPITQNEAVATEAIKQEIKTTTTLKQRLLNALKVGSTEALKEIFNHPFVNISVETVKAFIEAN